MSASVEEPLPDEDYYKQEIGKLQRDIASLLSLLGVLGKMIGIHLRQRQMPDKQVQMYWEREGRIVMPPGIGGKG